MKRVISLLLCVVIAMVMCVAFTGCDMIDEMRAAHGILSEDRLTVNLNDKTYYRLPVDKEFFCTTSFGRNYCEGIDVTDKDVPLLLKSDFSYIAQYDMATDIINVRFTEGFDPTVYEMYFDYYYCNEEDYERLLKAYNENEIDSIGIGREYQDETYAVCLTLDVMNEDFTNEIMGYLNDGSKMSAQLFEEIYNKQDYMQSLADCLYKCDKDGVLAECLNYLNIVKDKNGNAYLKDYNTEKAVKLSEKSSVQLDDWYFTDYIGYW